MTNPATSQPSPSVMVRASVMSVFGDVSPVVTTTMVKKGTSLLSVPSGHDPLEIHVPLFLTAAIGQSHPFPGSSNIITVTLISSCDFEARSLITISGVTGSLTTDVLTNFPVDTNFSKWYATTSWVQDEGKLNFMLFNSGLPSGRYQLESFIAIQYNTPYVFWFHVQNPYAVQSSPMVNISAALWSPGGPLYSPILQEMTKEHATVLQVPTASDPLFVWNASFLTQLIGQSNPLSKASNLLTVTFQVNFEVLPGSNFTITGLTGTLTPDTNRLGVGNGPVANPSHYPNRFSAGYSRWTQEDGRLVLLVASSLNAFEEYVVEFELRNSAGEQKNPQLVLESTLDSQLQSILVTLSTEQYPGLVNTSTMALAHEYRFGVANASLPLFSMLPVFEVTFIRQDFFYPNFTNSLSVSLKMNCNLTKNTLITISGLTRTQTRSASIVVRETQDWGYKTHELDSHQKLLTAKGLLGTPQLIANQFGTVTDTGLGQHFENDAGWNQTDGRLVIVVAGGTYVNTTYEVQFNLTQPVDNAGFPRNVTIMGSVESGTFDAPIYISEMVQSSDTIYDILDASAPLFTYQPKILKTALTQQSPFPGIANVIQARFSFDISIVPGAKITISGFKSMQTVSTRTVSGWFGYRIEYLPCEIRPFDTFSHQCEFDSATGEVILTSRRSIRRHVEYHANFTLLNPAMATISDELWAAANIPYAEFDQSIMGRAVFGKFQRDTNARITSRVFEIPRKSLLGIEQTLPHKLASTDADTCHTMAVECSLSDLLHTCSFQRNMASEIAGCLVQCNNSAATIGSNEPRLRSACCGLQCLDNCWLRSLQDTHSSNDSHAACTGTVDKTCPNGVLPRQVVSLMRTMPYDMRLSPSSYSISTLSSSNSSFLMPGNLSAAPPNYTGGSIDPPFLLLEKEHVFEMTIAAVLSPPCLMPDAPWECHTWINGSFLRNTTGPRLTGAIMSSIDILSGQAVFTDLAIVDAPLGLYTILFYVANSTVAHFQGRTSLNLGMQIPGIQLKFLATDSWPVRTQHSPIPSPHVSLYPYLNHSPFPVSLAPLLSNLSMSRMV